jgi:cytochrome c-type biogenesis protein CcmH/NrfF
VDAGETDQQIRAFLVEIYGEDIDYAPSAEGVTGLVWILPPLVAVAAIAGLVVVFRRWRLPEDQSVGDADVALVDRARRDRSG